MAGITLSTIQEAEVEDGMATAELTLRIQQGSPSPDTTLSSVTKRYGKNEVTGVTARLTARFPRHIVAKRTRLTHEVHDG